MPAPNPFANSSPGPSQQAPCPALYLYPLNSSFVPKHIALPPGQHVKIGRQTNAKSSPGERNGYFDSKVLSRQHAEVWEEGGKIYIKDVKSSNGTFINSERLSAEGVESEPYEIKTDDIIEFGIDIVGEDNQTVMHRKVAARAVCVFTDSEAAAAARGEQSHQPQQSNGYNFSPSQRRPPTQPQGLGGMGGMRPPGKSGLTFDHILSRLQGELQKSRETGSELASTTGVMGEIHETLGGALPPNLPPYPQNLPPVQPLHQRRQSASPDQEPEQPALSTMQTQLEETRNALAEHIDKMRGLESMIAEHDAIKHEVETLREVVEAGQHEIDERKRQQELQEAEAERYRDDDDDASSIHTVVPHELERVEEEDEDQAERHEEDDDRRRTREDLGRPRTPEPSGMGMRDDDYGLRHRSAPHRPQSPVLSAAVDDLTQRLTTLATQLESALELSNSLQTQHTAAQTTISALETKIEALEALVSKQIQSPAAAEPEPERESLTEMLTEWKKSVDGQWGTVREEWSTERERLARAREEWESKVKSVEASFAARVNALQQQHDRRVNGLITPPSPRSLSADSNRPRHRRKRSPRGRSASGSRSRSPSPATAVQDGVAEQFASPASSAPSVKEEVSDAQDLDTKDGVLSLATAPGLPNGHSVQPGKGLVDPQVSYMSTAAGILVLGVAAAAVIWRVKPE